MLQTALGLKPLIYKPLDSRSHTTVDGRINDAISLNPSGRDIADRNRNKGKLKLLNFKKNFTISVMNV